jgi:hypothetical protein
MTDEPELYTITRLASLYRRDRRTIEHLIGDIAPATIVTQGARTFRRWRRGDVHDALSAPTASDELRAAFEVLHGIRAAMRRLKRERRTGQQLDVPQVKAELGQRIVAGREAAINLVQKVAPQIVGAAEGSRAKARVRAILKRELQEIAENLAAAFRWERH